MSLSTSRSHTRHTDPPINSDWIFRRENETLVITSSVREVTVQGLVTKIPFSSATDRVKTLVGVLMSRENYVQILVEAGWKRI